VKPWHNPKDTARNEGEHALTPCAHCGEPRRLPKRSVHKTVPFAVYEDDPYCSTACAKAELSGDG
jgi:hypothetical protein